MKLPDWLTADSRRMEALLERDQLPHALLVHGPAGVGRRALVFWLVERLLGQSIEFMDPAQMGSGTHPDFRFLQPLEDKKTISIDQVRELIGFLTLTSHQSGAKVAVISPAQAMTHPAANSLLKTLEEPTAHSYLILIAESLSSLPATIISRCHQVRVPLPARQDAIEWLHGIDEHVDWSSVLELSAGAPLTAVALHQMEFPQLVEKLEHDLQALRHRKETPASVAKRWSKLEPEPCLRWLFGQLSVEIREQIDRRTNEDTNNSRIHRLQKGNETLNMEPSFAVLRQIGELRRLQGTGLNTELHLTDVLARWYGEA